MAETKHNASEGHSPFSKPRRHLSDEQLAQLFARELSWSRRWMTRRHLAECPACRTRFETLQGPRAEQMLVLYGEALAERSRLLSNEPRDAFAQWLEVEMQRATYRGRVLSAQAVGKHTEERQGAEPLLTWRERPATLLPVLAATLVCGIAVGVGAASGWMKQQRPSLTSNALLVRAETSYLPAGRAGVVHQTVQIRSRRQTLDRSVFWDLQGKRQPRRARATRQEEEMRASLTVAGVDWDQPVSASAYQAWHDQQHERTDRITKSAGHLLTLTTSVPDGEIAEESLTVRDTDFHPVRRTVGFRSTETVEIAELDYQVLPWTAVDASAFEPVGGMDRSLIPGLPHESAPLPHLPQIATADQLDETELTARLILSQFHADSGEQIEVDRRPRGIVVEGVVESDARKNNLQAQLRSVPHLQVRLQSVSDLGKAQSSAARTVVVDTTALPDQPSPIEAYLHAQGRDVNEIRALAQRIFGAALAISQESRAIEDLNARFAANRQLSVMATATLVDLIDSHRQALKAAAREERSLLANVSESASGPAAAGTPSSLAALAARNLALANELIETNAPARRRAEAITSDLSTTLDGLAAAQPLAYPSAASGARRNEKD